MPRIAPGFHVEDPPQPVSLLVYAHRADEVARALPGWYRFHDRVQPFREVLVEWAPEPDVRGAAPQCALLCGGYVEEDEVAAYAVALDCVYYGYQEGTTWSRVRAYRGGAVVQELYWGPDHSCELREAGLAPPPLDAGEVAVVVGSDQLRYQGPHAALVCALAAQAGGSREVVDRVCRESGIGIPDPLHFPDVDYDPQPGDDRDPQLAADVVDCWLR